MENFIFHAVYAFLWRTVWKLREKCPNTEFFFLVRIQENADQKNSVFGNFSRSAFEDENVERSYGFDSCD